MYNLIIRNKELTITPSNHSYSRKGDTLIGQFNSYTQVANWVASIPDGFGRSPLNNVSWLQTKSAKYTGKSLPVAKPVAKASATTVAPQITRRTNEEKEDMGLGHMEDGWFMNY